MTAITLGPLALSVGPLALLTVVLVASVAGLWAERGRRAVAQPLIGKIVLIGVFTARIAFIAMNPESYRTSPWSVLDIRDNGFFGPAGIFAAVATAAWFSWRRHEMRKSLLVAAFAGTSFWSILTIATMMPAIAAMRMPEVALISLAGGPVQLRSFTGKPLVVNFWASWCPPCRVEMPVLRDAQARLSDVEFVFANQGESADAVRQYLAAERLDLNNVLLDPRMQLPTRTVSSRGLPTTLFFNTDGKLVERHYGEISAEELANKIEATRNANLTQDFMMRLINYVPVNRDIMAQ